MLKWIPVHSETVEMCESYFFTSWFKVKNARVFQIALERSGEISPSGVMGNFGKESDIFIGWWKSVKEWFWPFKVLSMLKTPFCKYWTIVKPKLVWSVWNWNGNGTGTIQLKMKFILGYYKKIVVLQGEGRVSKNLVGKFFLVEEDYPRLARMMEF